jgi:alkyl sulfatase BDS1-like metallo-beta-lactamase superfamily hydrolase
MHGREEIAEALTDYRDAIQWVRDEVVRRANRGEDLDGMAEAVKLPPHLRGKPGLAELYGQVDWSVRGIYTSSLGWFDGGPDRLYPLPSRETAQREIRLMGGPERVLLLAEEALRADDPRWGIHLLVKLDDSGLADETLKKTADETLALSYEKLAEAIPNTNGRAYLLESALELREGPFKVQRPEVNEDFVAGIPLETIFTIMPTLLDPEKAMDVHESVQFVFPDENRKFVVTVRRGVAEVVEGEPLPGTPDPVAVFRTDGKTYRKIALRKLKPASALASGKIKVEGSWLRFLRFMGRFNRGV